MNERNEYYTSMMDQLDFKQLIKAKSFEGKDVTWRNLADLDLTGFNLVGADLSHSILPANRDLFQKILGKSLYKTRLPRLNLGDYDLRQVNVNYADLSACIFPEDPKFLLNFFMQQMHGVVFPRGFDLAKYDVNDVSFTNAVFMESVMPEKFFMEATLMPTGITFINCDFRRVVAKNIEFINCNFINTNLFLGSFNDVTFRGCAFDQATADAFKQDGLEQRFSQNGNDFQDCHWDTVTVFYRFLETYCR